MPFTNTSERNIEEIQFVWKVDTFYVYIFVSVFTVNCLGIISQNDLLFLRKVCKESKINGICFTSACVLLFIDSVCYRQSSTHRPSPYRCTHYGHSLISPTYLNAQITFGHLCEQPTSACFNTTSACSALLRLCDRHL